MTGADCAAALGAFSGSCSITLQLDDPVVQSFELAEFQLGYMWIPPAGYEVCFDFGDPTCEGARVFVEALLTDVVAFGVPTFGDFFEFGTFVEVGVRPIPEPGTGALLVALGLVGLSRRRR